MRTGYTRKRQYDVHSAYTVLLFLLLLLPACTTIPVRFVQDPSLSSHGGYRIEGETAEGFSLEIFYKSYSFLPTPDPAIQDARTYFTQAAAELARRKGKSIVPLLTTDLHTSATRNIMDGYYAVYVTGRVLYAAQ